MKALLTLEDGSKFEGVCFGSEVSSAGEVVFNTGMVGYPESLTDPSYKGQILVLTYPLIGNWGVPEKALWESAKIQVSGLVVSDYSLFASHYSSKQTLGAWLKKEGIPGIEGIDTRSLTRRLREKGVMLGKIEVGKKVAFWDPNKVNLVQMVGGRKVEKMGKGEIKVVLIDCGAKNNISRSLAARGVQVKIVPWDWDPFVEGESFDALVISNGPGDPTMAGSTIRTVQKALERKIPCLGICLGSQIMALAAEAKTYKLKFGHRGQNQPCKDELSGKCFITSQNHGFAVLEKSLPKGWLRWFTNLNDGTNEGIIHQEYPFLAVQFHPEAAPGPTDTNWIFDFFLSRVKKGGSRAKRLVERGYETQAAR